MLRIVANSVKIFAGFSILTLLSSNCYADQSNSSDEQVYGAGKTAVETFSGEGVIKQGAKSFGLIELGQEAYAEAKVGKYGKAAGIFGGGLVASSTADAILESNILKGIGHFCSHSKAQIILVCAATASAIIYKSTEMAKDGLGELGNNIQNIAIPSTGTLDQKPVNTPIDTSKMRSAKGQWLYVDMAPDGAKLGWGNPNEEHFDGIFMNCSLKKKTIYIAIDVDDKTGQRSRVRISRGAGNLSIQGIVEEAEYGSNINTYVKYPALSDVLRQPGDIVITNSSGSTSYSLKNNGTAIDKFVAACGLNSVPPPQSNGSCLTYQGRVTISGKLERRMFPGPPNYESVARGDSPDPALIMKLDRAACVDRDASDAGGLSPSVASINEIQVVPKAGVVGNDMSGRSATLSGRLFGAHTGHHRTKVLLDDVQVVSISPSPNSEMPNSIFVQSCMKDGSGNLKQCSCAETQFRKGFGPRGFAVIELAVQGKIDEAKALFQKMSFNEQFNYGAGTALAANRTNSLCGTRIRM